MAVLEVYLVRHGVAAERGPEYPDDTRRPLTDAGKADLRRAARGLNAIDVGFDVMIASPLVRTRQTADVLADTLTRAPRVVTSSALAPEGTPDDVIREIRRRLRRGKVALVGHEPNIGELAARLIGSGSPVPFKKGAVCRIDFDVPPPEGAGTLRWFLQPRMLRKLG